RLTLNGIHLGAQLQQDTRLVTGPCTDLQYLITRTDVKQFGLVSDGIRLGNRLAVSDWKGDVFIRLVPESLVKKKVPRHLAYGIQHLFVRDSPLLQQRHQLLPCAPFPVVIDKLIRHYAPKISRFSEISTP